MTLKIDIKNFLGISTAAFEFDGIAIVCGPNGAGKTSLIQGLHAANSGSYYMRTVHKKADVKDLVHGDATDGHVIVWRDEQKIKFSVPSAAREGDLSLGILTSIKDDRPAYMSPSERKGFFRRMFPIEVGEHDFMDACNEAKLSPAAAQFGWKTIEQTTEHGTEAKWDAAAAKLKEKATEMKGRYRQATGQGWGSDKSETWHPDGIDPDNLPVMASLEKLLAVRRGKLEEAIAKQAVSASDRKDMLDLANRLPTLRQQHEEMVKKGKELAAALHRLDKELDEAAAPVDITRQAECPSCHTTLIVGKAGPNERLTLTEVVEAPISEQEQRARQMKIDQIKNDRQRTHESAVALSRSADALLREIDDAMKAEETLKKAGGADAAMTDQEVETCRAAVAETEGKIAGLTAYEAGKKLHTQIKVMWALAEIAGPNGARLSKFSEKHKEIADGLKMLTGRAQFPDVVLDEKWALWFRGYSFWSLSRGQQWIVNVAMQCVAGKMLGVGLLVFDNFQDVEPALRANALRIIKAVEIPTIVCLTASKREQAPVFSKGTTRSFWIENGVLSKI